ncbi:hypothetical protein [Bradyrhizobium cenepequi]|uniref:hypothetical protein n=1 Tax=Bradyrhizobium cenepequi TaxID=2821403 RepID=UPI001CE3215E|nr:hypothetical protein [Bradyrhizobium cenepequi]MCA6108111.1 hypothetical protein [Bradyrhizobium cenepequi]
MSAKVLDTKLAASVKAKVDALDDKTVEGMAAGNLTDWGQYQRRVGYRRAIADVRTILAECLEDVMKE